MGVAARTAGRGRSAGGVCVAGPLTSGAGALSRPLIADTGNLGAADVALLELIEEKTGFEMPELVELTRPVGKKRKKH